MRASECARDVEAHDVVDLGSTGGTRQADKVTMHECQMVKGARKEDEVVRGGDAIAGGDAKGAVLSGVAAGVRAYALKQAAWHDSLSKFFRTKWNVPAVTTAQHPSGQEGWDQFYALE
ncbi:hypothetical protein B0H14DRAFT_2628771 [Mycena olivaceomarginata]|nr:hypothetical protein B0H14DRAFT_2628771 [Mycena olivaceomarginata]